MADKPVSRFIFWFLSLAYGAFLAAMYFGEYLPEKYWWIPNLVLISPLWVLLIPLILLLVMGFRVNSIKGVYFHSFVIILFVYFLMDFRIPLKTPERLYGDTLTLRVITVNMEGIPGKAFYGYADRMDANVILFQEFYDDVAKGIIAQHFLESGWEFISNNGLALATKFPVIDTDFHEHYLIGARVATDGGDLMIYGVHLETPREGVESLIHRGIIGRYDMQGTTDVQLYESATASTLIPRSKNIIVAGDFNLPANNPIYRKYWGHLQNAFLVMGKGFGHSKFTRWYGVRIDHILTDPAWTVLKAEPGPQATTGRCLPWSKSGLRPERRRARREKGNLATHFSCRPARMSLSTRILKTPTPGWPWPRTCTAPLCSSRITAAVTSWRAAG